MALRIVREDDGVSCATRRLQRRRRADSRTGDGSAAISRERVMTRSQSLAWQQRTRRRRRRPRTPPQRSLRPGDVGLRAALHATKGGRSRNAAPVAAPAPRRRLRHRELDNLADLVAVTVELAEKVGMDLVLRDGSSLQRVLGDAKKLSKLKNAARLGRRQHAVARAAPAAAPAAAAAAEKPAPPPPPPDIEMGELDDLEISRRAAVALFDLLDPEQHGARVEAQRRVRATSPLSPSA